MNKANNLLKTIIEAKQKFKIHFVGIGGVSTSSLAIYLKNLGHRVTGSDVQKSQITKQLQQEQINVFYGHNSKNVEGCNVVIYSYAVQHGVEVKEAQRLNIPCFSRAQLLGAILKTYKTPICVAGAHGKTTTTALIYTILKQANKNVNLHLGGTLAGNKNANELELDDGKKDIIVCEACEYKDAFLNLKPAISVVTNIAPEHLDYFKNFNNVKKSFNKFAKSANVLICENLQELQNKNKIFFGINNKKTQKNTQFLQNHKKIINNLGFVAQNLKMQKDGTYVFSCYKNAKFYGKFHINLIGEHNVKNAVCAIAVADHLGISKCVIQKSLSTFGGVQRRFEVLNKQKFIVHDYAHHPQEINAVIGETQKFYKGKLLIVFQPHTYSRTKTLMADFVDCFKNLNDVVIYKTYSAREKYSCSGSAKTLAKNIGTQAVYFKNKSQLLQFVNNKIQNNYGVLFLGAGNINEIAKNVINLC